MSIPWKEEYALGIPIIDEQHKKFVKTLNDLYESLKINSPKDTLTRVLEEIDEYARFHFETEEKYFKEFDFAGTEEHLAKHQEFREKLADIKTKFMEDKMALTFELMDFLENWLLDHVSGMDTKYVKCFKEHGL